MLMLQSSSLNHFLFSQVEGAMYVCLTKLHTHLEPENCILTLNMAVFYSLNALKDAAIELICSEALVRKFKSQLFVY